jgi:hypothetical protein
MEFARCWPARNSPRESVLTGIGEFGMSTDKSKSTPSCPKCGGKLRLLGVKAGEQVRCPKCNNTFTVGKPKPRPALASDEAYEPVIPLKPSQILPEEGAIEIDRQYEAETQIAPMIAPSNTYQPQYEADWSKDEIEVESPAAPPPSLVDEYTQRAKERGLMRERVVERPPRSLFFSDVFTFPWQGPNIARWAIISVSLTICSGLMAVIVAQMMGGVGTASLGMPLLMMIVAGLGLLTLGFAAACFIAAVDDTADGQRDVQEATMPAWDQWIFSFFSLSFVWTTSGALGYPLVFVPGFGPPAILVSSIVLFPILMLSALECDSFLLPISAPIWRSIVRLPGTWLAFYLISTLVVGTWFVASGLLFPAAPGVVLLLSPMIAAAVLLIYARLLGRLAWRITMDGVDLPAAEEPSAASVAASPRRSKKRRKVRKLKLDIPDDLDGPPIAATEPPPVVRPKLDFHHRP